LPREKISMQIAPKYSNQITRAPPKHLNPFAISRVLSPLISSIQLALQLRSQRWPARPHHVTAAILSLQIIIKQHTRTSFHFGYHAICYRRRETAPETTITTHDKTISRQRATLTPHASPEHAAAPRSEEGLPGRHLRAKTSARRNVSAHGRQLRHDQTTHLDQWKQGAG
jgi:hypothetical protein